MSFDRPFLARAAAAALLTAAAPLAALAQSAAPAAGAAPGTLPETTADADAPAAQVNDPFEGFNRGVYSFNDAVDRAVVKPVATGYQKVVPEIVRGWVTNFFGNLDDAWSLVNLVLQGKPRQAYDMTVRVTTNTVLGLGGFLDIASAAGIDRHEEDFGQTLGWWGVPSGPFLMLPLLGPSQVRDAAALPLDMTWDNSFVDHEATKWQLTALDAINTRANLLTASGLLDTVALDRYSFLRDAYVQRRQSMVYDGNPPQPK